MGSQPGNKRKGLNIIFLAVTFAILAAFLVTRDNGENRSSSHELGEGEVVSPRVSAPEYAENALSDDAAPKTDPSSEPNSAQSNSAHGPVEYGSKTYEAVAKGISVVPGAIVCPNLDTTRSLFEMYTQSWSERTEDAYTHGESILRRGLATQPPDFASYGCALLPVGTPMKVQVSRMGIPIVTAKMTDGLEIFGVTLPSMLETLPPKPQADSVTSTRGAAGDPPGTVAPGPSTLPSSQP